MIWIVTLGFWHFKSPICHGNSKSIHEIHRFHSNYFFEFFSHIIHLYFVPWLMIDNPTSCDKIMYSILMCFHPICFY